MVTLVTVTSPIHTTRMGLNKQQSRKRHCDTATTLGYSLAVFVCASIRARELPMKTAESIEAQEERKNARDNAKPCLEQSTSHAKTEARRRKLHSQNRSVEMAEGFLSESWRSAQA
jgi:hypothetical protein